MKILLSILLLAAATWSHGAEVLVLVTGADRMTNGKPTGLWLEEYAVPYLALKKAGHTITTATLKGGAAPVDERSNPTPEQAKAWSDAAAELKQTKPLANIDVAKFDAIFLPGGHGVMFDLASDPAAAKVISQFAQNNKIVAAVCHGPAVLVGATGADGKPIVAGKKVSTFTDDEERAVKLDQDMPFLLETKLRELGANIEKSPNFTPHAVRDGNLITGQNPPSSEKVAELVIEALKN